MEVILGECRSHTGVSEASAKETCWKTAGAPQGGCGHGGLERKRQM